MKFDDANISASFLLVNKVINIYLRVLTFVESSVIRYGMMMPRIKKPVSYALDPKLLSRLDKWLERQELPVKKTAVIEAALTDWLDKKEKKQ